MRHTRLEARTNAEDNGETLGRTCGAAFEAEAVALQRRPSRERRQGASGERRWHGFAHLMDGVLDAI